MRRNQGSGPSSDKFHSDYLSRVTSIPHRYSDLTLIRPSVTSMKKALGGAEEQCVPHSMYKRDYGSSSAFSKSDGNLLSRRQPGNSDIRTSLGLSFNSAKNLDKTWSSIPRESPHGSQRYSFRSRNEKAHNKSASNGKPGFEQIASDMRSTTRHEPEKKGPRHYLGSAEAETNAASCDSFLESFSLNAEGGGDDDSKILRKLFSQVRGLEAACQTSDHRIDRKLDRLHRETKASLNSLAGKLDVISELLGRTHITRDGETATFIPQLLSKLGAVEKKVEQVGEAVGVVNIVSAGDDDEDRRRLKEKLKDAIESDKRNRAREILPEKKGFLEFMFGICETDKRTGKQGSRCMHIYCVASE